MYTAHESQPPAIPPWDLPNYYRRLKATILKLENAWEAGDLGDALSDTEVTTMVGPRVVASYRHLLESGTPARSGFRRDSIHAILEPLKELLADPRHVFRARVDRTEVPALETGLEESPTAPQGAGVADALPRNSPIRTVVVPVTGGERHLRLHHLVGARFWGIGFEFDDPEDEAVVVRTLVGLAVRRLAADLEGLFAVERWLRGRPKLRGVARIVPDQEGRRFEQLMLDILNEGSYIARRASLSEDFLEKTDLRVHPPGLTRRHGARVQVTQTIHRAHLQQKLSRIRRVNEFIILSPSSLADALSGPEGEEMLNRAELKALWECLPFVPATVEDLGVLIKERFLNTYALIGEDPQGPAEQVPDPLRLLVQRYVMRESFRSTTELRERERQSREGSPRR